MNMEERIHQIDNNSSKIIDKINKETKINTQDIKYNLNDPY